MRKYKKKHEEKIVGCTKAKSKMFFKHINSERLVKDRLGPIRNMHKDGDNGLVENVGIEQLSSAVEDKEEVLKRLVVLQVEKSRGLNGMHCRLLRE
eukprot:g42887.t1